jgi:NADH-quinone oxidoreductase subunit J
VIAHIGLAVVSLVMLVAAFQTVNSRDLVRSVLWLGIALSMTAVLFLLLSAPFLAGVQILLYAGGVITLMLFGVMLTRKVTDVVIDHGSTRRGWGAVGSLGLFGALAYSIMNTQFPKPTPADAPVPAAEIGRAFLTDHLLAFEVLSLLLLAVMVGAIVLGRKRDAGAPSPTDLIRRRAAGQ